MIRELSREEMSQLYHTNLQEDFTPEELKPWMAVEYLIGEGKYFAYGMFEDEKLMGYAFFTSEPEREYVLLDYYAVTKEARGQGVGSRFIREWKRELKACGCKVVLAEVEAPDTITDPKEKEICARRVAFYHRNGLEDTPMRTWLWQVKYQIMILRTDGTAADGTSAGENGTDCGTGRLYQELIRIYREIYPSFYFGKEIVMSDTDSSNMVCAGICERSLVR